MHVCISCKQSDLLSSVTVLIGSKAVLSLATATRGYWSDACIFRNMIADLGPDVTTYKVSESAASFAKLVDAMYAPQATVTAGSIDELSGKSCERLW